MGDFLYWGLLALVLSIFYFRKPRKPISNTSDRTYAITFSKLRDRDLLNYLSNFTYPESYVFELIQSDMKGLPVPSRTKALKVNPSGSTRTLLLKLNTHLEKDLIDYLDSHGYFYNSYVKGLIRKDMNKEGDVGLVSTSEANAAY